MRRLEQGARHAFTVLTSNYFVDTGAAGNVSSKFAWPSNQRWTFLTVADRGGTPAPALPVDYISLYPNCDAVRSHYPGGVRQGSPIYRLALDRDRDGIACEPTSSTPSGNHLPIQSIGTFTGTGDRADDIVRLDAGVYRVTSSRTNTEGNFFVDLVELRTGQERSVGIYGRGENGGSETETIYDDDRSFLPQAGNYVLQVDTGSSWEIRIELLAAH